MNLAEIRKKLDGSGEDLRRFGVRSLALFGSAVRGEAHGGSDADILAEFAGPVGFDRYMEVKFYLEDLLGIPVDLVTRKSLDPRLLTAVEAEAVRVA